MLLDFIMQNAHELEMLASALILWLIRKLEKRKMNGKHTQELDLLKSELKKR